MFHPHATRNLIWSFILFAGLVAIGGGLNKLVAFKNGGYMPVEATACKNSPSEVIDEYHACVASTTKLAFLDDRFVTDDGSTIYSAGDVVILVGEFGLILAALGFFFNLVFVPRRI